MNKKKADIGLADLITVLRELPLKEQQHFSTVGDLLGFADLMPISSTRKTLAADFTQREKHRARDTSRKKYQPPARPSLPFSDSKPTGKPLPTVLEPEESANEMTSFELPNWLNQIEIETEENNSKQVTRQPLLSTNTVKGVLSAALRTRISGRRIDNRILLQKLVQAKSLYPVPRLSEATLLFGAQLLLDQHDSMAPFYQDFRDIVIATRKMLGESSLEVFKFRTHPHDASDWTKAGKKRAWKFTPGRPVMLVTDFRLGDSSNSGPVITATQWQKFAHNLKQKGCAVISLVPIPPGDWPNWVAQDLNAIHWDQHTRAEALQKRFGMGHEVRGA